MEGVSEITDMLPVNSEGDSAAADTTRRSLSGGASAAGSQNTNPGNAPDLVGTRSRLSRHGAPASREKQFIERVSTPPPPPSQQQVATLSPPVGQFVINSLLQVAAFSAAIAFGVYAVKSVRVGSDANRYASQAVKQAVTANQLALLAVCFSSRNQTDDFASICSRVISTATSLLPEAVSTLFTSLPSSSPEPFATLSSKQWIGGAVVGAAVGLIFLLGICAIYIRLRSKRQKLPTGAALDGTSPKLKDNGQVFRKLFVDSLVTAQIK